MRSELQPALRLAETVSLEDVAAFLGELEQIRVTALARLSSPAPTTSQPEELLDVDTTARRLGVSKDYLYRNQSDFPFVRKIGRKILISSTGLEKYLARLARQRAMLERGSEPT